MTSLELTGLRGHHPLGFLAACGVLRCCAVGACDRKVTLAWKETGCGPGWLAVLEGIDLDLKCLISVLIKRAEIHKGSPALLWSSKIDSRTKFREAGSGLLGTPDSEALGFLAALASDVVVDRKDKNKLQPTSLDLTSGNQRFLKSIVGLSTELADPKAAAPAFQEALCGPWQYRDDAHSLGWDPQTQRLHALRHMLPERDKQNRSVRGAVFLASCALPLFPCFAIGSKLRTTGFHQADGEDWFAWPIWQEPISLDTLRSLLSHPLNTDLKHRGIHVVYRSLLVRTGGAEGNYRVFGNAQEHPCTGWK